MAALSAQAKMEAAFGIGDSRHDGIMRSEGECFAQASWIGVEGRFFHYNTRKEMRTAAVFAKDFTLEAKPEAAALKISVAGYWDIRVFPMVDSATSRLPFRTGRRMWWPSPPAPSEAT